MGLPWGSPIVGDDVQGPSFLPFMERTTSTQVIWELSFSLPGFFPAHWSGQLGQLRLGCWAWELRLSVSLCLGYTGYSGAWCQNRNGPLALHKNDAICPVPSPRSSTPALELIPVPTDQWTHHHHLVTCHLWVS